MTTDERRAAAWRDINEHLDRLDRCHLCRLGPEHVDEPLVPDRLTHVGLDVDLWAMAHPLCIDARDAEESKVARTSRLDSPLATRRDGTVLPITFAEAGKVLTIVCLLILMLVVTFR